MQTLVLSQFVIPRSASDEESSKIPRCDRNDKLSHYQTLQ